MADLRARFESWREARERARLEHLLGTSAELELERIDDEFGDVTGGAALAGARADAEAARLGSEREQSRRFALGLAQAGLARALRPHDERIARRAAAGAGADELDDLRAERIAARGTALARLGFATQLAFAEALRPDAGVAAWGPEAEQLLAQSESDWRDARQAPGSDSSFAAELPAARLQSALDFALEGMRLELARAPGLRIDSEPRPGKPSAPLAGAPRIPDEVWLAFAPAAGSEAYAALFAAAGEALHLAHTSAALPVERRCLGDPGLTPAFGACLRALFAEPGLGAALTGAAPAHFAAALRRQRLGALRLTAARVLVELRLAELPAGSAPEGLGELWAEQSERATGRARPEVGHLAECGPALQSLDALRGACLGAQLAAALRVRFGREPWKLRGAGELLRELFDTGTTYTPEALARELSLGPLSADALLEAERAR